MFGSVGILIWCALVLVVLVVLLAGARRKRREATAMRSFATMLRGKVIEGTRSLAPHAVGTWGSREVDISLTTRLEPHVYLTVVAASRRDSPFAALFMPREKDAAAPATPGDAPPWRAALERRYEMGGAPAKAFDLVVNEHTANTLSRLEQTEIEVMPDVVYVRRRKLVYSARELEPLVDAAVELASRLEDLEAQLLGATEEERVLRAVEMGRFIAASIRKCG